MSLCPPFPNLKGEVGKKHQKGLPDLALKIGGAEQAFLLYMYQNPGQRQTHRSKVSLLESYCLSMCSVLWFFFFTRNTCASFFSVKNTEQPLLS